MTRKFLKAEVFSLIFAAALAMPGLANQARAAQYWQHSGSASQAIRVPVLRDNISIGTVINKGDIVWTEFPAQQVGQNIITDANNLVGMAARWSLAGNRPIRETDVRPPILAKKGSLVTMIVTTANMTLSATGRALQDGALGDTIRIINPTSNKTVEGVVMADGNIAIGRGMPTTVLHN